MNKIKSALDNQTELIKLIIKKMEIKTELDEYDSNVKTSVSCRLDMKKNSNIPALRKIVLKHFIYDESEDTFGS